MADLNKLAKLMASFNYLQGKKVTYGQIERFLKKEWSTGPFMIFSLPLNKEFNETRSAKELVRISWNRRSYGGHYPESLIDSFLKSLLLPEVELGIIQKEGRTFFLFESGETSTQKFYGFFEIKEDIEKESLKLLSQFLCSISKGWNRLDELKKVENLVHVDDVTGLYNQRKLLKDIDVAVERYKDFKEVFTILFIDIDHFKSVNDGHGHLVGTQLLSSLGQLLKNTLRESDLIYRYGGDEFVMIIPDVNGDTAKAIGERVLKVVKETPFSIDVGGKERKAETFNLTVSIGVATYPEDAETRVDILDIADKMMYEAKQSGRGRVCFTRELLSAKKQD